MIDKKWGGNKNSKEVLESQGKKEAEKQHFGDEKLNPNTILGVLPRTLTLFLFAYSLRSSFPPLIQKILPTSPTTSCFLSRLNCQQKPRYTRRENIDNKI